MSNSVVLRIKGGSAELGDVGISLKPRFARRSVLIPWENVMFVSPVPSVRYNDQGWSTYRGEHLAPETLQRSVEFYSLEVALNDRHAPLAGTGALTRMWLRAGVWLKPLYVDDDAPHPLNGCLRLYFPKRWVRKNGRALIDALEVIRQRSRFDLLITID